MKRHYGIGTNRGTNGPNVRVEFSGEADLMYLLHDLLPIILTLHAIGPATDKLLAGDGWRFDRQTGKATRIREGAPGEGKDLFTEAVWRIYAAKYRVEYQKASTTPKRKKEIRQEIADMLAPLFLWLDAEQLSPKSQKPIYWAIWNGDYRAL